MKRRDVLVGSILSLLMTTVVWAEPTQITVRVLSKGAKFIGSSMSGALVTIEDADTGELLASGVTEGDTGDTKRIMQEPRTTKTPLATEKAAKFTTTLQLDRPRRVQVTALGPLSQRQAANQASATQWLVPGGHVTGGDAWLLEIPGLVVDVLAPPAHQQLKGSSQKISLRANVTMLCGCPIGPETPWKPEEYQVRATILRDGRKVTEVPLTYAGTHSQFEAEYEAKQPGTYEAIVYAYQPANGNTGLDRTTWVIKE